MYNAYRGYIVVRRLRHTPMRCLVSSFSQRMGIERPKLAQLDSVDNDLTVALWNALYLNFLSTYINSPNYYPARYLMFDIWVNFLKREADEFDKLSGHQMTIKKVVETIKGHFLSSSWNRKYDLVEFILNVEENEFVKEERETFTRACNWALEKEVAGYRVVGRQIVPITSQVELDEVEQALDARGTPNVQKHLDTALRLLADRSSPDYRNSIKESMSAVEAMCKLVTGDEKATVGQAVKALERDGKLHSSLKDAFSKLYGYTSDANGIRHALGLTEEPDLKYEDAKFMLVCCSAFINFLRPLVP